MLRNDKVAFTVSKLHNKFEHAEIKAIIPQVKVVLYNEMERILNLGPLL